MVDCGDLEGDMTYTAAEAAVAAVYAYLPRPFAPFNQKYLTPRKFAGGTIRSDRNILYLSKGSQSFFFVGHKGGWYD